MDAPTDEDRCPTGIQGLDELIEGGFPRGRTVLLRGECGTGKTIFGMQFIYNGIVEYEEPGIFVCLEQSPKHLKKDLRGFNFDLQKVEDEGKLMIIDASLARVTPLEFPIPLEDVPSKSFQIHLEYFGDINNLIDAIIKAAKKIKARRVVIDSLPSLNYLIFAERYVRNTILSINYKLIDNNLTSILISDIPSELVEKKLDVAEYITDSVINLNYTPVSKGKGRFLVIRKMRGTEHNEDMNPIKFVKGKGIMITKSNLP